MNIDEILNRLFAIAPRTYIRIPAKYNEILSFTPGWHRVNDDDWWYKA